MYCIFVKRLVITNLIKICFYVTKRIKSCSNNSLKKGKVKAMENIKLRKYCNKDYEFVYNVKKISYKKYVEKFWGNWDEKLQRDYFDNFIKQEKENAYVIQYRNEDIGFYNGKIIDAETYEIGNICILPNNQGNGIGTKILKGIIVSVILTLVLLFIYSAILTYTNLGENTIKPVVIAITGISILARKFNSSKLNKEKRNIKWRTDRFNLYITNIFSI